MRAFIFTLLNLSLAFINQTFCQTVNSYIDHENHKLGTFELEYEFGMPYNAKLPTVIVIADAQQFYVRTGRIKKIQEELFGNQFNVLGIIPRSFNKNLKEKVSLYKNNTVDWNLAYSVFKSFQYVNDIACVIQKVLPNEHDIYLYGQSGGAFLITEYLSAFPDTKVKKVFIGACVHPIVENHLGVLHDDFQRNYLEKNPNSRVKLEAVLKEGYFDRKLVAALFQRQNFFVEVSELNKRRDELMTQLYKKDTAYINQLKQEYQIDAINNLLDSEAGVPIRVRLSEFICPLIENRNIVNNTFYPDLENSYNIAYPLVQLNRDSPCAFISKCFAKDNFKLYEGEIFILSGRYDHVADYRSSIYLSGLLKNSILFIANDDHTFKALKSKNEYSKLIKDFFLNKNLQFLTDYEKYKWIEK